MDVRQFLERAFPDHSIGEKLREDAESALFRGRRLGDGQAVEAINGTRPLDGLSEETGRDHAMNCS